MLNRGLTQLQLVNPAVKDHMLLHSSCSMLVLAPALSRAVLSYCALRQACTADGWTLKPPSNGRSNRWQTVRNPAVIAAVDDLAQSSSSATATANAAVSESNSTHEHQTSDSISQLSDEHVHTVRKSSSSNSSSKRAVMRTSSSGSTHSSRRKSRTQAEILVVHDAAA
eukprot:2331-Heterococcus_DN1.PRE.1